MVSARIVLKVVVLIFFCGIGACSTGTKKSTPPTPSSPVGSEEATESHRKTVVSRAEEFRKCYAPALKRNARLRGSVTLSWDVNSAGDVVREDVIGANTTIQDQVMIECMLERIHAWKFDTGPKDTISTVVYPFYFNPSL